MNEALWRYIYGLVLCLVISVAYSTTRKRGLRAILLDSAFCLGCMLAVVGVVGGVVYLLCAMK
ncbi:MAG: hypothetical protein ACLF0G_14070 [Candidatus Brocadiia bacterium]